jgi:prepilin-type N-terminal cleavage/methylation domain-containing protein
MKNFFSKTAYTLIELIVSLALVSIVLLGIFSVNMVLNNNNQDYGQKYLVKSQTQAVLNQILNNASLAVGSGTTDSYGNLDLGILIGAGLPPGVNDANSICIHQAANNNIVSSAGDIWLCYTWYPAASATNPYQIYWCTSTFTAATGSGSYRGAAPCTSGSSNFTYLGTAYSMTSPTATYSASTGFSITLQNCLNDSLASCNGSGVGVSSDPADNPEVSISGSVFPQQQGSG